MLCGQSIVRVTSAFAASSARLRAASASAAAAAAALFFRHLLREVLGVEVARLDREVVQFALLHGLLQDVLLDGALAHHAVDVHLARLPDAVRAVLRLRVHRGVPVRVVEDDGVGARQVDAEPARARREDEREDLRVRVVPVHHALAALDARRAVEPQVRVVVHR